MVLCKCSLKIILTSLYLVDGLAWWDWPFTWWTDQLLSFSAWHCWLGHLTRKNRPRYDLCRIQSFGLLHHFQHRTRRRSRHVNQAIKSCKSISDIFPLPVSFQTNANTSYAPHNCCSVTLLFIDIGQYMSKYLFFTVQFGISVMRTPISSKPSPSDSPAPCSGEWKIHIMLTYFG